MISESSKETVPEFYFTSFIILLTQLEISIFKNWMDVLLSIKQNKNVKNMSFVIFYTDIVSNIFFWGGGFSLWRPSPRQFPHAATQYSPFFSHEQLVE